MILVLIKEKHGDGSAVSSGETREPSPCFIYYIMEYVKQRDGSAVSSGETREPSRCFGKERLDDMVAFAGGCDWGYFIFTEETLV